MESAGYVRLMRPKFVVMKLKVVALVEGSSCKKYPVRVV